MQVFVQQRQMGVQVDRQDSQIGVQVNMVGRSDERTGTRVGFESRHGLKCGYGRSGEGHQYVFGRPYGDIMAVLTVSDTSLPRRYDRRPRKMETELR